jgi:hypothetical protein
MGTGKSRKGAKRIAAPQEPLVFGRALKDIPRAEVERFIKLAADYQRVNSASKEIALKKLIELGILDEKGELTENYR